MTESNLSLEPEIWKDVPQWEDLYQVSSLGRIRRIRHRCFNCGHLDMSILKSSYGKDSYAVITLYQGKRQWSTAVHIIVAMAFHGPRPSPKHDVNHIDFNPSNNAASNLEWLTRRESLQHSINAGRAKPINKYRQLACQSKAVEIKDLYDQGHRYVCIGRTLDLLPDSISHFARRNKWARSINPRPNVPCFCARQISAPVS